MFGAQPCMFPPRVGWPPLGYWGALRPPQPPKFKTVFNRNPEKLPFFLNQVWSLLDQHGAEYADDEAWVDMIVANLEGEAAELVMILHDEGVPELGDPDTFLGKLRA